MEGGGVVWRALLGLVIFLAVVAFVFVGFDAEQVDEEGNEIEGQAATPRATATAVLSGPQPSLGVSASPGRIEAFCRELDYAEPPCAGVVSALCAELGPGHPDCRNALDSYCAIRLASPAVCAKAPTPAE